MSIPAEEAQRRQALAWATTLTSNTPLEPQAYERRLLEMYWIITHLQTHQYNLVSPRLPITDPHLLTLLGAFSQL
ncbi:hypothetical protein F1C16_22295 (plasmid) [Hymenobacter sp. NBH84]|nr:hypothetical protein F1C16_22295 [Hymenobacter sp. NBH84]